MNLRKQNRNKHNLIKGPDFADQHRSIQHVGLTFGDQCIRISVKWPALKFQYRTETIIKAGEGEKAVLPAPEVRLQRISGSLRDRETQSY